MFGNRSRTAVEGRRKRKKKGGGEAKIDTDYTISEHLTEENACYNLFTWGWSEFGCLGIGETVNDIQPLPSTVDKFGRRPDPSSQILHVSCGGNHTVIVNKAGEVYTCGRNQYGQLGLDDVEQKVHSQPQWVPVLVDRFNGIRIAKVSANFAASFALSVYGELFSWGSGRYGVLGHENEEDCPAPREIQQLRQQTISDVSAGLGWHVIALEQLGKVFTWGRNNYGQIGNGEKGKGAMSLQVHQVHFSNTSHPVQVCAGQEHCIALVTTHRANLKIECEVFTWGNPGHGRLGSVKITMHQHPQRFTGLNLFLKKKMSSQDIDSVFAGGMHTLVITKPGGNVISWGCGMYGALGYGFNWDQEDPQLVPLINGIKIIAAGMRHTLALDIAGRMWTWGYNAGGELGLGDTSCRLSPHQLLALKGANIQCMSAGHAHSAVTTTGRAITVREDPEYKRFFNILQEHGGIRSENGRAVYMVLKKTLERRGMNAEVLRTPKTIVPGQPGSCAGIHKPKQPEFGLRYCLDTVPQLDDFSQRGSYEAVYRCFPCKQEGICMACARYCHLHHKVEALFRFRHNVTCSCSLKAQASDCKVIWSKLREIYDKYAGEIGTILFASVRPILEEIRADKDLSDVVLEAAKDNLVGVNNVEEKRITFKDLNNWYTVFFDIDETEK